MKTLLFCSALLISVFASSTTAFATADGKEKSNSISAGSELRKLFKSNTGGQTGNASALVHFDAEGKAEVLEMSANTPEMEQLLAEKLQDKSFKHLRNDTIRLVVELRK